MAPMKEQTVFHQMELWGIYSIRHISKTPKVRGISKVTCVGQYLDKNLADKAVKLKVQFQLNCENLIHKAIKQ